MDVQRIHSEVRAASQHFPNLEALPTTDGGVWVKAFLQTSVGRIYMLALHFNGYPHEMPKVYVTKPTLGSTLHIYNAGNICYMHPNVWNPGRHDLKHVLAQAAVWLNKYEVYQQRGIWPGPGISHAA